jgi:hypothetical protein
VSVTRIPVCTGSVTRSRSMIEGAGRSIGHRVSASTSPFPSSGRPSGSTMRPSRRLSDRHAHDFASPEDGVARLDVCRGIDEDAANQVGVRDPGEAELAALESQNLVNPDVAQSRDHRHAIPDLFDATPVLRSRTQRRAVHGALRLRRTSPARQAASLTSLRIVLEISPPAVAQHEMRAAQFQTGDQVGIGDKTKLGLAAQGSPDRVFDLGPLLADRVGRGNDLDLRRRGDQRRAVRGGHIGDRLDQPGKERRLNRRSVEFAQKPARRSRRTARRLSPCSPFAR